MTKNKFVPPGTPICPECGWVLWKTSIKGRVYECRHCGHKIYTQKHLNERKD